MSLLIRYQWHHHCLVFCLFNLYHLVVIIWTLRTRDPHYSYSESEFLMHRHSCWVDWDHVWLFVWLIVCFIFVTWWLSLSFAPWTTDPHALLIFWIRISDAQKQILSCPTPCCIYNLKFDFKLKRSIPYDQLFSLRFLSC